jgi:Holliday junction resolvase
MKPKESEKTLEARLVREIEARGGMALKYTSQFHRGIPDRIVLLPYGLIYFVELKSTGKKPTKLQTHALRQLFDLGFPGYVIDNTEGLDKFLGIVDHNLKPFVHSA